MRALPAAFAEKGWPTPCVEAWRRTSTAPNGRCGFTIDSGVLPLSGGKRRMHRVVRLEEGWEEPLQLDLLIADGGTYADAYESRYAVPQEDAELWLVALDELIAMKREADRPSGCRAPELTPQIVAHRLGRLTEIRRLAAWLPRLRSSNGQRTATR